MQGSMEFASKLRLLMLSGLFLVAAAVAGCDGGGPAEQAGQKADEAMEQVGEKVDQAAEQVGEKVDEAAEEAEKKAE